MRFCRGCKEIDAGKFVLMFNPNSIEEAINGVRKYQLEARVAEGSRQLRGEVKVNEVKEDGQGLALLMEMVSDLKKRLDDGNGGTRGGWRGRGRGRGGLTRSLSDVVCFACEGRGHYARDCPGNQRSRQAPGGEGAAASLNWTGQGGSGQSPNPAH